MSEPVNRDIQILASVVHTRRNKKPKMSFSVVAKGILLSAALLVSMTFTTGGAMAAGLSPTAAATQVTSTIQQEVAATEKQYTDAVFTAVDYASIDYEPKQLKDLAVALDDLAKWLYQTGSISDLDLVRGSVGASERLLIKNGEGDGSDAVKASYITASVAVANAKTAWKSIYKQMEAAENASKAESPGIHVAPSHTDADPLPPGSTPTPLPDGSVPLAPTPAVSIPDGLSGPDLFKGPWVTQTAIASIIPSKNVFALNTDVRQANSMSNFKRVLTYPGFTDVKTGDWFHGNVKTAYEYGFVTGKSTTTFDPTGDVTIQEAIVMAARIRSVYEWGSNSLMIPNPAPVGNEGPWASAYINYAIQNGLISKSDFTDYAKPATRAEMAHIFANVLPASTGVYTATNTVDTNAIPDVTTTSQYSADIYKLYKAGILTGTGDARYFEPNSHINRASTAAIASRLPIISEHADFDLLNPSGKPGGPNGDNGSNTVTPPAVTTSYLADQTTKAPWQGHIIYVGTATDTSLGQPRSTSKTATATSPITVRYGFHNYNSNNQAEYDAVIKAVQSTYDATVKKGYSALVNVFGLDATDWQVIEDIIKGKSYDKQAWNAFLELYFPAVASNISDAKTQAETVKLYAQYRKILTSISKTGGETNATSAYDILFNNIGSCVGSSHLQTAIADMLGIDCATYASKTHQASVLKINGVYFDGETELAWTTLTGATGWADQGMMTEWTSSSTPTK